MNKFLLASFVDLVSVHSYSSTKIIGGTTPGADSKILKSTVSLMVEYKDKLRSFCTGTVIAPNLIITAAHCVASVTAKDIVISSGVNANLGQQTRVSRFKYFYQNYYRVVYGDGSIGDQDMALLETETDLNLQPVKIGLPSALSTDTSLIMTGYGVTSVESDENEEVSLNDTGILYSLFGKTFSELKGSTVTISELTNKRTAGGDSGGPLYETIGENLVVHGVLSNGGDTVDQVDGEEVQTKHSSEYTHPYFYMDWINCALDTDKKISSIDSSAQDQKACDGSGLEDIHQLASFNNTQCEKQWPGFKMVGEGLGSCMPSTYEACQELGKLWKMPVTWDEESKDCSPKVEEGAE
jgi:secreted trypsin-like serine protease